MRVLIAAFLPDTDQLKQFIHAFIERRSPEAEEMAIETEEFLARQIVVEIGSLGKKPKLGFRGRITSRMTKY